MIASTKETQLKKLLIKQGSITAVILTVLLGIGFFISGYDDSVVSEQSLKQSQNNTISSEYHDIETNLGRENEVAKYYDDYTKTHNKNFVINRESVTDILATLRKIHHLSNNIEVTVSPITEVADSNFIIKSGKIVKSTVRITFGALTDNSVYNFIYDLQHKLPGIVLVSDLKITKSGELSRNSVMLAMNQHTIVPMVTGELSFVWIGINPSQENGAK